MSVIYLIRYALQFQLLNTISCTQYSNAKTYLDSFWEDIPPRILHNQQTNFQNRTGKQFRPFTEPYTLDWVREHRMTQDKLHFGPHNGKSEAHVINEIAEYGIDKTRNLVQVIEPEIFKEGLYLKNGDAALYLAAFNKQKHKTKNLARYGYATLKASELLSKQLLLTRQQTMFGLEQISIKNTALYDACPFKKESQLKPVCPAYSAMYRTLDGTCNNLNHPEWGSASRPFARFLPPDYSDGIESFRESVTGDALPNVRKISSTVHRPLNKPSYKITMMVMQWGQFLDHDITSTSQSRGFNHSVPKCCNEQTGEPLPQIFRHPDCMPIEIPKTDIFYSKWKHTCMEFLRSSPAPRPNCALGPRDQINQVTSFIDASSVYGSDDHEMANLRLWEAGMLNYKPVRFRKPLLPALFHFEDGECRENSRNLHCFQAGDLRVNEQPALASMHTIWMREHNRLVTELTEINPQWNDDRLFFEARRIVGAAMQKITYGEWLPMVLGPAVMKVFRLPLKQSGYYMGYQPTVNPSATNAFASAAFRFGHSLVQHTLQRYDKNGREIPFTIKLHQELMNPSNIHNFGSVDRLMFGMIFQRPQGRDVYMTDELTRHLFQTPGHHYGLDLASINIQRGRDHGLPSYNIWREQCGLHKFTNWGQLLKVMDDDTVGRLATLYSSVDDIDLFTGGLGEKPVIRGIVGPTFACILGQMFLNLRRGDRFWFENGGFVSSLRPKQLQEIRKITLSRILCDNLDDIDDIQYHVFRPPTENGDNIRRSCKDPNEIPKMDLSAWKETVDEDLPNLLYSAILNNLTSNQDVQDDNKLEPQDLDDDTDSSETEEELYILPPEENLTDDEIEEYFSKELPRPFQSVDDEKSPKDSFGRPFKQGRTPFYSASNPGVETLTQHNFNNVIEQAYSDTLFYGKKKK